MTTVWLRHCATSRKVAGSIPDGFLGIFLWQSFRPHYGPGVDTTSNGYEYQEYFLVEGGGSKGGRCIGLTTLPHSCVDCLEIWEPQPPESIRAPQGLCKDCFTFTFFLRRLLHKTSFIIKFNTWRNIVMLCLFLPLEFLDRTQDVPRNGVGVHLSGTNPRPSILKHVTDHSCERGSSVSQWLCCRWKDQGYFQQHEGVLHLSQRPYRL